MKYLSFGLLEVSSVVMNDSKIKSFEKATEIISPPVVLGPELSFTISHHSINSDLQYSSLKRNLFYYFLFQTYKYNKT